ncbi:hypothetical protein VTK26DRAFT_6371 [Humicola hyalothermophila]
MTPRPSTAPTQPPQPPQPLDEAPTPTRANFGTSALASQRPLPTSPFPESVQVPEPTTTATAAVATATPRAAPKRANSQHSRRSRESDDVDMDDSDNEGHNADEGAGSDGESVNTDGTKAKKKKSQRFYCTDYPPCNLSFTRSEHLARHIRKHTGERPFQCHCSRRFSRLDNLRQHAQTVHVNEDIPIDSLAATGTRFQRQIRTDRVRQPGSRARASTAGSVGPGGRGHSKSLSTSSIASATSIGSTYGVSEARRRPAPLIMADPRMRLSGEPYRGGDGQYYRAPSPSDFSTPTSATFSTGQSSPRWGPVMSPGSSHSRSHSMYAAGSRTPGRRLSVPSSGNPFQSPHGPGARGPLFGPLTFRNSSNAGAFSPQSSLLSSPTVPTSPWSRRDSMSSAADEAWRRRTWHPDTREYNGASRLSQVITPSQFPPETVSPDPDNQRRPHMRLPGIESFDGIRPPTPPHRNPSPMMIDANASNSSVLIPNGDPNANERRSLAAQWDMNLHRGLTRLDINTPPRDSAGAWANEANQALLARAEQTCAAPVQPVVRFEPEITTVQAPSTGRLPLLGPRHHHTMSAPSASALRESRRHGWYNGPVAGHPARETIPEGRPHVDRMVHPNIGAFQGFPARDQQQPVIHQEPVAAPERARPVEQPPDQGRDPESLKRLEALVAVATSENSAATAY